MYVLTSSGVTGFAVDWVERKGIEHLCNCHFPEGTECWVFSEEDYALMGEPPFEAIEPEGDPNFVSVGKAAWKVAHPELFDDYVPPQEDADAGQGE